MTFPLAAVREYNSSPTIELQCINPASKGVVVKPRPDANPQTKPNSR